jgi:hypothetical protein
MASAAISNHEMRKKPLQTLVYTGMLPAGAGTKLLGTAAHATQELRIHKFSSKNFAVNRVSITETNCRLLLSPVEAAVTAADRADPPARAMPNT